MLVYGNLLVVAQKRHPQGSGRGGQYAPYKIADAAPLPDGPLRLDEPPANVADIFKTFDLPEEMREVTNSFVKALLKQRAATRLRRVMVEFDNDVEQLPPERQTQYSQVETEFTKILEKVGETVEEYCDPELEPNYKATVVMDIYEAHMIDDLNDISTQWEDAYKDYYDTNLDTAEDKLQEFETMLLKSNKLHDAFCPCSLCVQSLKA